MSSTGPGTSRSILEEMLESLKRRDEKPKDVPPALPVRPTLRGRMPSSKQSLPLNFKIESDAMELSSKKQDETMKVDRLDESPFLKIHRSECYEETAGDFNGSDSSATPCRSDDTIDSDFKKASVIAELQRQIQTAEAALRHKEEENNTLRQQLQQNETRWSEYEAKTKSNEEFLRKEVKSLQMSLALAKKNLADAPPNSHNKDSESATSANAHGSQSALPKQTFASDAGFSGNPDGSRNPIDHLAKEFQQQTRVFEDDAQFVIKKRPSSGGNNIEELQKLKLRFVSWKKDYKARLHKTKTELEKVENSEGAKTKRKWWGKRCRKK